jgi:mRNA interferase RelE/StbE
VAKYKILIKPFAVKEIESIPLKKVRQRIVECISKLAENPHPPGSENLSGQEKYRLRHGSFRILYAIEEQELVVTVVRVGHRKNVYR